jgi:hypothetical protein
VQVYKFFLVEKCHVLMSNRHQWHFGVWLENVPYIVCLVFPIL